MSQTLQTEVDPLLCASQERVVKGYLPYSELQVLQADIEPASEPIEANLMFSKVGKFVVLTGRISARLVLQCAACLELTDFIVDIDVKLAIINKDALVSAVPADYEPFLYEGERLLMSNVVESEVVLMLPDIVKHDICPVELPKSSTSKGFVLEVDVKTNPFEVLESLKKD